MTGSLAGDRLVSTTIWVALGLYALSQWSREAKSGPTAGPSWPRLWFTLGGAGYLAHVVAAFDVHYAWSHAAAYAQTADQTAALLGLDWGGGLWVNYAFTAVWIGEAAWWWVAPDGHRARPRGVQLTVRAVFLFMIVNGAVVFVDGPMRWVGLATVGVLIRTWWRSAGTRRAA